MRIRGSVKLVDLEYAKRLGSDKTPDSPTVRFAIYLLAVLVITLLQGTHHFMACEVELHSYLFHIRKCHTRDPKLRVQIHLSEPPRPPFAFNPVHDLESLWWIWVWVMYFYVHEDGVTLPPEQDKAFQSLFPKYLPTTRLQKLMGGLKADVPIAFRDIIYYIETIRGWLVNTYLDMEAGSLPPDYARFLPDFMDCFIQALELAVGDAGDIKLYIPLEHRKRKEPEPEEGNLLSSNSNKRSKQG